LQADLQPILASVPVITPLMIGSFLIFFQIGFFLYASIFALIGSMVTSVQEGWPVRFPTVLIMHRCLFIFVLAVIRDPERRRSRFGSRSLPFLRTDNNAGPGSWPKTPPLLADTSFLLWSTRLLSPVSSGSRRGISGTSGC
jgi:hypothetical protein